MIKGTRFGNFIRHILKERFRITFFHDDFKPVFSLRFTLFTLILWAIGFATLIIIVTTFIIARTSLREYVPGYGTAEDKQQLIYLLSKTDSLDNAIQNKNLYIQSILKALKGETDTILQNKNNTHHSQEVKNLKASEKEQQIRAEIHQDIFNRSNILNYHDDIPNLSFLPPTKGIMITAFNPQRGHYGIDIAGKSEESVRSIYKGIVVSSGYSINDGNFIIIAHPNGFTSVYKHLSVILKTTGVYVMSNEIIGTMGNTGTESTGTHLHFELWYQDVVKNPTDLISF